MNNRSYLAILLKGGLSKNVFRSIECKIDTAGQVSFSHALEYYSPEVEGTGYFIDIHAPGGVYEKWIGEGGNSAAIVFRNGEDDQQSGIPVTPEEILSLFQEWKARPEVLETITEAGGIIKKDYAEQLPRNT